MKIGMLKNPNFAKSPEAQLRFVQELALQAEERNDVTLHNYAKSLSDGIKSNSIPDNYWVETAFDKLTSMLKDEVVQEYEDYSPGAYEEIRNNYEVRLRARKFVRIPLLLVFRSKIDLHPLLHKGLKVAYSTFAPYENVVVLMEQLVVFQENEYEGWVELNRKSFNAVQHRWLVPNKMQDIYHDLLVQQSTVPEWGLAW